MIGKSLFVATILTMTVGLGLAHANDDDWAGFYIGIDALDGSIDQLSIVPNGDGTFDIRMVSDGISLCDAETPAGMIVATGRIVDGQLVRENVRLKCEKADETALDDGAYTRDGETGILTLPAPDDGRQMQYHRLSGD
jgi:hypothetical protein